MAETNKPTARLSIVMDGYTKDRVGRLAEKTESNITDVVKSSLKITEYLAELKENGSEIVVRDKDGKERVVEFFM